jgi:acyl carrier protein phosphodiesterase
MNYLGHLVLSGSNEKILLGNFLGDHVSNKTLHLYDSSIQNGIELHREIDLFTDSHPISRDLRSMLFDQYRHKSRVILDLFYDHFLAADFHDFKTISLSDYVKQTSTILQKQLYLMPKSAKHYFMAMQKYGWLEGYTSVDGIRFLLNQMSRRNNMDPMGSSVEVLEKHYPYFRAQTHAFLNEAIAHFVVN